VIVAPPSLEETTIMQRTIALLTTLSLTQIFACDAVDDTDASALITVADAPDGLRTAEIDVHPATLDDAVESLAQIDALLDADPADPRGLAARIALRPRLDELNHLIARIEPMPGHVINFYEPEPGVIGVMERAPSEAERLLVGVDLRSTSVVEVYRGLAGEGAAVPKALVAAQLRAEENAGGEQASPGERDAPITLTADGEQPASLDDHAPLATLSADVDEDAEPLTQADAAYWQNNVCYHNGNANYCKPNWWNGGYAEYNTKTSALQIAPFSGQVTVRLRVNGITRISDEALPGGWYGWNWNNGGYYDCPPLIACGTYELYVNTHRWDILNASGNGFHWTARFNWTCHGVSCPNVV
jgi:hypothetical protein